MLIKVTGLNHKAVRQTGLHNRIDNIYYRQIKCHRKRSKNNYENKKLYLRYDNNFWFTNTEQYDSCLIFFTHSLNHQH